MAAFGWLVIIIVVIIVIVYKVVEFVGNELGSSNDTGVRAFGAILIVVIIGLGAFFIVRLIKSFFNK